MFCPHPLLPSRTAVVLLWLSITTLCTSPRCNAFIAQPPVLRVISSLSTGRTLVATSSTTDGISDDTDNQSIVKKKDLPPGRPTNPLYRFLFDDTVKLLNPRDMKLLQRKQKFGPIFKTNFLFQPCVFVTDETSIQLLAREEGRKSLQAFFPPQHLKLFGPNSLLVQSGETHARIRRLVMDSMSPTMITSCEPLLRQSIADFFHDLVIESQQEQQTDDYITMVPKMRSFFTSIVLQVVLGTTNVSKSLMDDLHIWSQGLLAPPLFFLPFSTAAKAARARTRVVEEILQLIKNYEQQESAVQGGLLAKLVAARDDDENQLTQDEIVDNLFTLIFAGSDTTSSAAISIWKVLSEYPQLKGQLRNNPERLELFIKDALEAHPPAPFNMRRVVEELDLGEYRVPTQWLVAYGFAAALEGTIVKTTLDHHHHQPSNNVNPTVDGTGTTSAVTVPPPTSSLAFGKGRRRCPGRYLATSELRLFTTALIELDWELDPNQSLEQTYTPGFFPVDGFRVKFIK